MHGKQANATGSLVKIVNVLCYEQEIVNASTLEICEGVMSRIRFNLRFLQSSPALIVEPMNKPWVTPKSIRRCDVFEAMSFPQSIRTAEGWYA